jgi:hypothetical protein
VVDVDLYVDDAMASDYISVCKGRTLRNRMKGQNECVRFYNREREREGLSFFDQTKQTRGNRIVVNGESANTKNIWQSFKHSCFKKT